MIFRADVDGKVPPASGPERKGAMRRLVLAGVPVGLLAYADGTPVGWCSVAPRTTFRGLDAVGKNDDAIWSLTCFCVHSNLSNGGDAAMEADVRAMIDQAIDCEMQFAEDLLGQGVAGLSPKDMRQYLEYCANQRLGTLGFEKRYRLSQVQCSEANAPVPAMSPTATFVSPAAMPGGPVSARPMRTSPTRVVVFFAEPPALASIVTTVPSREMVRVPVVRPAVPPPLPSSAVQSPGPPVPWSMAAWAKRPAAFLA